MIQGAEGLFMGRPTVQRKCLEELVEIHPEDPRSHTLLGNHYFGNQEYDLAINQYKIASKLNPGFSTPYNQIGYAYRYLGDYSKAESAFKKYISLLPNDPNPYDSYAELLLEMGEYEVSIENYEKALEINPDFSNSYLGIATNLNLSSEHGLARKKLKEMLYRFDNAGIRRQALGAMAISFVDQDKYDQAIKIIQKRLDMAARDGDTLAMVGDYNVIGIILHEQGRIDESEESFRQMMELVNSSGSPQEIKDAWERISYFQKSRTYLARENIEEARKYQELYMQDATNAGNIGQIRNAHSLAGMIFYAEKKYQQAIIEFEQSNFQNPYNLYYMGLVYEANGDLDTAKDYYQRAAGANSFNNLNYSFVRNKAIKKINLLRN